MTNVFEQNNQANVPAAAASKPAPKKVLNTFAVRELTPSPPPQNNNPTFPPKKLISANGIFNQDEQKVNETKAQSQALPPKKKLAQFVIQNEDSEEEKKEAPKRKPMKKLGTADDGGFMAQLEARLAKGPPAAVQKRPVNPPGQHLSTPLEIVDAKLSIPKMSRSRGVTKKYDVSKYNFENF